MPPVHGCPVTLCHGWDQLHTRVSTTGVRKSLSRTRDPHCLPGVVHGRTMLLCFSGQLARTLRAWSTCRSRLALAVYGGLDFNISKWASYFSCRSLICNPLMSLRSHCSKVASLTKAKGHREYGLGCTAEVEWLLIVSID
jgi:hypothetical protein